MAGSPTRYARWRAEAYALALDRAAAALVLIVSAVVVFLVAGGDEPPPQARVVTVEAETLATGARVESPSGSGATVQVQQNCCEVTWSQDAQLFFLGRAVNDRLTVTVALPAEATWQFSAVLTTSFDYANTVFLIDGRQVGDPFIGFSPKVRVTDWVDVGRVRLGPGTHEITLVVIGKTQSTNRYFAGVDQLRFTEVGPEDQR